MFNPGLTLTGFRTTRPRTDLFVAPSETGANIVNNDSPIQYHLQTKPFYIFPDFTRTKLMKNPDGTTRCSSGV